MSQRVSKDFPGIFGIFRIFSVALMIYLDISGFIFAQENISKKTFLFYLGRARRLDPVRFGPAAGPREPIRARQPRLASRSHRHPSACVPHTPGAPPPRLFTAEPEP
jgi:hypothetical protein